MSLLRCMAEGRDGAWWAICIDLDISVQGETLAEVRDGLRTAIALYLERVSELPEPERAALLRRRSPWHLWAKFHLYRFLDRFLRDGNGRHQQFFVAAPA